MSGRPILTLKKETAGVSAPAVFPNEVWMDIRIDGKTFQLQCVIDDAPGTISLPDRNEQWLKRRLAPLLSGIFGKLTWQ